MMSGGGSAPSRWHGWSGCVCHDEWKDVGLYVPHCGTAESPTTVRSTFAIDSEEEVVRMCQGSGRVRNASRRVAGQCVKGATGVERQGKICLSLLKGKGMGKGMLQLGHLVENRHLLQGMCRPQHVGHKSCLLEVPPWSRGWESSPESPPSPPSEELVKALQLLQSVLTPEDFSKYEKKLVPPKQQNVLSSVSESFLRLLKGKPIMRNRNRSILK